MNDDRICNRCGKHFKANIWNKKYCCSWCQRENHGFNGAFKDISTGTVGAIAELKVSTDLMERGFEVYRALSQSSSCDILALKNGNTYTFEVRTGYRNKSGGIGYSKNNVRAKIIAVVIHQDGDIIYIPDIK